jgi:hypothetical protein
MRPLNAGELAMATPIESFTAVLLQLNMHYKTRVALKLTGIPDQAKAPQAVTDPTAAAEPNGARGAKAQAESERSA